MLHAYMYSLTLKLSPYLNIGHDDEVHSSSLSVLSSAAVQRLWNWDYSSLSEFTQDVVLFINLCNSIIIINNMSQF